MAGDAVGTVGSLWRYPVKSMAGEQLAAAEVTGRGVAGDRAYGLAGADGRIATAKSPRTWPGLFGYAASFPREPRGDEPPPPVTIVLPDGRRVGSDDPDVEQVLSGALAREVTVRRAGAPARSAADDEPDLPGPAHAMTDFDLPEGTLFDAAAVHLLTTATLRQLAGLYPQGRMDVRRFRPNVVVESPDTLSGFVENDWVGRRVRLGDEVELAVDGRCPRCVMTTLPQGDLPKDSAILRTAAQHNGAHVGVYASVVRAGTVRRGDRVELS